MTAHMTTTPPDGPSGIARPWLYAIVISGITVLVMLALVWTGPETGATLQPPPLQRVITEPVRELDFQPVTSLTGKIQPARKARLHFEVSGRVIERRVEPGQTVEIDELMLAIDSGDYQDAVEENRALLEEEREAVARDRRLLELIREERDLQAREVERLEQLGRDALAARSQYDAAMQQLLRLEADVARLQHSVGTAAARLRQREAAHQRAKRDFERAQLLAPFPATVDTVNVEVGDYVTPGQSALSLVQVDRVDLFLAVTGRVASHLRLDQTVDVHTADGVRTGRIVALQPDPDPLTHTHALRIRMDANGLLPGQLASAELPGPRMTAALIVPATAVLHDDGQAYVFQVIEERLVKTAITLKQRYLEWQVIEGVPAGSMIVARDVAALADGQPVSIK